MIRRISRLAKLLVIGAPFVALHCSWDYQVAEDTDASPADTGASTDADSGKSDAYVLPDGRTCTGHDEDKDGVPDECDNCPNVGNPGQEGGAIGSACMPGAEFIPSPSRLLFDPFRSLSEWKSYGSGASAFQVGADSDSVIAGSATTDELPFLVAASGAASSSVVVTTTLTVTEEASTVPVGSAGVLLRVNGDTDKRFYVCVVGYRSGFGIAWTPTTACNGGTCDVKTFAGAVDGGTMAYQGPIPGDLPHAMGDTIGVRASVATVATDGGTSTTIECRVFDPKVSATLTSTDTKYSQKITVTGPRSFPSGEVGLYASRSRASFGSVDLLRGP